MEKEKRCWMKLSDDPMIFVEDTMKVNRDGKKVSDGKPSLRHDYVSVTKSVWDK
jgi:hypothetical protein